MSAYTEALAAEKIALQAKADARRALGEAQTAERRAYDAYRLADRRACEAHDARIAAMRAEAKGSK